MRRFRRFLAFALSLVCLFCALPAAAQENADPFLSQALQLTAQLSELAQSETYLSFYSASDEVTQRILSWGAGDYQKPDAAYRVAMDAGQLLSLTLLSSLPLSSLPDSLTPLLCNRLVDSVPSLLNAQSGSTVLAASSIAGVTTAFTCDAVPAPYAVYILRFDQGTPVIATFHPEQEGVFSAHATFLASGLPEDARSLADLNAALAQSGITVAFEEVPLA